MQTVHSLLRLDRLPGSPTTVRFEFTVQPKIYWLVLDGDHPELCFNDPGGEVELVVTINEQVLGGVPLGRSDFAEAVRAGDIRLGGRTRSGACLSDLARRQPFREVRASCPPAQ